MAIIYKGTNLVNGKAYIGQTKRSLEWRLNNGWCGHIKRATSDHGRMHISNAIFKYGVDNFKWEIIEEVDIDGLSQEEAKKKLDEREEYWIAYYDTFNNGYNQTKGGGNSISLKGRKMTWGDKIWATRRKNGTTSHEPWNKGKHLSDETKKKLSEALTGRKMPPRTEEYRKMLSETRKGNKNRLGKHNTEEARRKVSEALRGRKQPPEQTAKMVATRIANNSYKLSEEQKEQRRLKMEERGTNIVSDETRKRLSEAGKRAWAKRKASITNNMEENNG